MKRTAGKAIIIFALLAFVSQTPRAEAQITDLEIKAMNPGKAPFKLPELVYGSDALEPYIDARTMRSHHDHYHASCITNLDRAILTDLDMYSQWRFNDVFGDYNLKAKKWLEDILKDPNSVPEQIRAAVRTNAGAHYNHSIFWQMMKPGGGGEPKGELADGIKKTFGGFSAFKEQFTKAAVGVPGNGWTWLTLDGDELKIESTSNEDTPLSSGRRVLLGIDLWDHAYKEQYGTNRAAYVAAWFHVVNWDFVAGELKTNEWGPITCGAQLSLRLQETTGAKTMTNTINVILELRNVSNTVITTLETVPAPINFSFAAISPKGTEFKSKLPDRRELELEHVDYKHIKQGESLTATVNLLDAFNFQQAGVYRITVKRVISIPDGKGGKEFCDVPSNELKLTIPPPK